MLIRFIAAWRGAKESMSLIAFFRSPCRRELLERGLIDQHPVPVPVPDVQIALGIERGIEGVASRVPEGELGYSAQLN
jgi:hypothetical protein